MDANHIDFFYFTKARQLEYINGGLALTFPPANPIRQNTLFAGYFQSMIACCHINSSFNNAISQLNGGRGSQRTDKLLSLSKHNINDFAATKFVTKFCSKPLDRILENFIFLRGPVPNPPPLPPNPDGSIRFETHSDFTKKRILDIQNKIIVLYYLAPIFSVFEFAIQTNVDHILIEGCLADYKFIAERFRISKKRIVTMVDIQANRRANNRLENTLEEYQPDYPQMDFSEEKVVQTINEMIGIIWATGNKLSKSNIDLAVEIIDFGFYFDFDVGNQARVVTRIKNHLCCKSICESFFLYKLVDSVLNPNSGSDAAVRKDLEDFEPDSGEYDLDIEYDTYVPMGNPRSCGSCPMNSSMTHFLDVIEI